MFVVSTKCINPWVIKFVVSNTKGRCSGRASSSYLFFGQNVIDNVLYHLPSNNESNLHFSKYLIQINDVDKQYTIKI
jgi:hypothetical protein